MGFVQYSENESCDSERDLDYTSNSPRRSIPCTVTSWALFHSRDTAAVRLKVITLQLRELHE